MEHVHGHRFRPHLGRMVRLAHFLRGRSSFSAFTPNIAARTSLKAVTAKMTVILTDVVPTIRAGIHRDLLAIFTTCPTFHLQEVTIATVPIVAPAKPAKLTIARNTREFSVRVPTVIRIIKSTDLRRTWATGTGRTSCGRCRGPSTIGWSSRGPPAIAGTLDISTSSAPRSPPAIATTGLGSEFGETLPLSRIGLSRFGEMLPLSRIGLSPLDCRFRTCRPRAPISTHIPVGGNRNVRTPIPTHTPVGKQKCPPCARAGGECDLSGSPRALLLLLSALSLSG